MRWGGPDFALQGHVCARICRLEALTSFTLHVDDKQSYQTTILLDGANHLVPEIKQHPASQANRVTSHF